MDQEGPKFHCCNLPRRDNKSLYLIILTKRNHINLVLLSIWSFAGRRKLSREAFRLIVPPAPSFGSLPWLLHYLFTCVNIKFQFQAVRLSTNFFWTCANNLKILIFRLNGIFLPLAMAKTRAMVLAVQLNEDSSQKLMLTCEWLDTNSTKFIDFFLSKLTNIYELLLSLPGRLQEWKGSPWFNHHLC